MPAKNRRPFTDPNDRKKRNGSDSGMSRARRRSARGQTRALPQGNRVVVNRRIDGDVYRKSTGVVLAAS